MLPYYFGDPEQELFAIYHPPARAMGSSIAAVLCNPIGDEYVCAYRTMRVLAGRLAEIGVPVLRFDYYGTGDSAGGGDQANAEHWLSDVELAIEEVQATADVQKICLVGLRLGGTLAAIVAERNVNVSSAILWEPIVHGKDNVEDLFSRHREWLAFENSYRVRPLSGSTNYEALGYPMTEALCASLNQIDLSTLKPDAVDQALVVFQDNDRADRGSVLNRFGHQTDAIVIESSSFWRRQEEFDQALVPIQCVDAITGWMAEQN